MGGSKQALAAVVLGMTATTASAASLPGFSLAGQTPHVRLFARESAPNAERQLKDGERRLLQLARQLGEAEAPRADIYHYESAGDIAAVHGAYVGGLTFPERGEVHTTSYRRDHELVHLVATRLGDPGVFFQEGLAVALGDQGRLDGQDVDRVARRYAARGSLSEMIRAFEAKQSEAGYAVAGSFVRHLIRSYGVERVASFFRSCDSRVGVASAFQASFGLSLDAAGAAWASRVASR